MQILKEHNKQRASQISFNWSLQAKVDEEIIENLKGDQVPRIIPWLNSDEFLTIFIILEPSELVFNVLIPAMCIVK